MYSARHSAYSSANSKDFPEEKGKDKENSNLIYSPNFGEHIIHNPTKQSFKETKNEKKIISEFLFTFHHYHRILFRKDFDQRHKERKIKIFITQRR